MTDQKTTATAGIADYYRATVTRAIPEPMFTREASGDPGSVAAFLRAIADQIDPPQPPPVTKPTCRCATTRGSASEPTGFITVQQDPSITRRGATS